jgi:hypothetical protein
MWVEMYENYQSLQDILFFRIMNYQGLENDQVNLYEFFFLQM